MEEEKSKYFKIGEALDEVSYSYGAKDKTVASLKLLGKGVFNVGRFAVVELVPSFIENAAKEVEKNKNSSEDQIKKAKEAKEKAKEYRDRFNNS